MLSLSNSTLSLFLECPRCFWLKFNAKIPRPDSIFPSLPSGMDSVIKEYFNRYRVKGELPPLIDGKIKGKLASIPLNLKFEDPALDLKITGKLDDCLEMSDGTYAALDHKTRASLPNGSGHSLKYYQTQIDTYTLLLEKNGYKTDREAYIVYYSPAVGELHLGIPFQIEVHQLETKPERAAELFRQARLCLQAEIPNSSATCGFCKWKEEVAKY